MSSKHFHSKNFLTSQNSFQKNPKSVKKDKYLFTLYSIKNTGCYINNETACMMFAEESVKVFCQLVLWKDSLHDRFCKRGFIIIIGYKLIYRPLIVQSGFVIVSEQYLLSNVQARAISSPFLSGHI